MEADRPVGAAWLWQAVGYGAFGGGHWE
jgi:hypothetical protein